MNITWLYAIVGFVLVLQVGLFVLGRRMRKKERENDVLLKYNIKTRQEAWKAMANTEIPEEDRERIKAIYDNTEEQ